MSKSEQQNNCKTTKQWKSSHKYKYFWRGNLIYIRKMRYFCKLKRAWATHIPIKQNSLMESFQINSFSFFPHDISVTLKYQDVKWYAQLLLCCYSFLLLFIFITCQHNFCSAWNSFSEFVWNNKNIGRANFNGFWWRQQTILFIAIATINSPLSLLYTHTIHILKSEFSIASWRLCVCSGCYSTSYVAYEISFLCQMNA